MDLDKLLKFMTAKGASDLHLKPTRPPLLRIDGRLLPLETDSLRPSQLEEMLLGILSEAQKDKLHHELAVDLGYGVRGLARFRANIYMQRGHLAGTFRRVPFQVLGLEDLELPDTLLDFCKLGQGMVLLTGPTGSGKSTTLAAMIKYISQHRPVHVITIEDPIEFLFTDRTATISQREVGTDTTGFKDALRNAMRQDPDVIMVGEMRDPETISTVITAAETGHLVFSTLHTNSSTQTVDRILDSFPADQQGQVRAQLGQVLKGVASIKLVERIDGGRVAALEIMKASPKISRMIEKGETAGLLEEVESSVGYYRMQSMNQSLLSLLVYGVITYEEAMEQSPDPEDLSLKIRKMFPKIAENRQGDDDMSASDFSQIMELQEFRRLYEEQEEKVQVRLGEKDEQIEALEGQVRDRDQQIQQLEQRLDEAAEERDRMKGDLQRLRSEAQEKIDKLMERIKELNQRLMDEGGGAAAGGGQRGGGIFR